MMKKRNMATAMAAITVATSVAPVFADTRAIVEENKVDINNETAFAELRAELEGYFAKTYTEDTTLLLDAEKAGESVYTVTVNTKEIETIAEFDAYVNDLKEGATFDLKIVDKGFQEKDGKIVDCEVATYGNLDADDNGKADLDEHTGKDGGNGVVDPSEIAAMLKKQTTGKTAVIPEDQYVTILNGKAATDDTLKAEKVPTTGNAPAQLKERVTSNGAQIVVKNAKLAESELAADGASDLTIDLNKDSEILDLTKPIIKKVKTKDSTPKEVNVITGFESAKTALTAGTQVNKLVKVENNNDATSSEIAATDLYNEGRLATAGYKLVDALDEKLTNAKGDYLQLIKDGKEYTVENKKEDKTDAADMLTSDLDGAEDRIETISATKSRVVITISAEDGYKYENGMLADASKDLYKLTIVGTEKEVKDAIAALQDSKNNVDVEIFGGSNRYNTAVKVSEENWDNSTSAVLVSGDAIADGLAATPLAAIMPGQGSTKGAPILLTAKDKLPMEVKRELKRLDVSEVVITGGNGVVSDAVVAELEDMDIKVERVSGRTRFETSVEVAKKMEEKTGNDINKVFVAGGHAMADALSISAVAGQEKTPIILSPQEGLTDAQVKYLKDEELTRTGATIIGGEAAVAEKVETQLEKLNVKADRIKGKNRQHTNARIIDEFYVDGDKKQDVQDFYIVKSDDKGLVDALTAGAVASKGATGVNDMVVIASEELSADQKLALDKLYKSTTQGETTKAKVDTKHQIGHGIAESVIKAINSLVTKK